MTTAANRFRDVERGPDPQPVEQQKSGILSHIKPATEYFISHSRSYREAFNSFEVALAGCNAFTGDSNTKHILAYVTVAAGGVGLVTSLAKTCFTAQGRSEWAPRTSYALLAWIISSGLILASAKTGSDASDQRQADIFGGLAVVFLLLKAAFEFRSNHQEDSRAQTRPQQRSTASQTRPENISDREESIAVREQAVAERESAIGARERALAAREAQVPSLLLGNDHNRSEIQTIPAHEDFPTISSNSQTPAALTQTEGATPTAPEPNLIEVQDGVSNPNNTRHASLPESQARPQDTIDQAGPSSVQPTPTVRPEEMYMGTAQQMIEQLRDRHMGGDESVREVFRTTGTDPNHLMGEMLDRNAEAMDENNRHLILENRRMIGVRNRRAQILRDLESATRNEHS